MLSTAQQLAQQGQTVTIDAAALQTLKNQVNILQQSYTVLQQSQVSPLLSVAVRAQRELISSCPPLDSDYDVQPRPDAARQVPEDDQRPCYAHEDLIDSGGPHRRRRDLPC